MSENDNFGFNLMRMIAAEMHFQSALSAAREMFGKSYFSLGHTEKIAVDQAVIGHVAANYKEITQQFLADQEVRNPIGFGIPKPTSTDSPSGAA